MGPFAILERTRTFSIMFTVVALALPLGALGHGYMSEPRPRNVLNCPVFDYKCKSDVALPKEMMDFVGGSSPPGSIKVPEPVCGAGKSDARFTQAGPSVKTYQAGELIEVSWQSVAAHGGHYSYHLCPDGSDTEDCFKKHEMTN